MIKDLNSGLPTETNPLKWKGGDLEPGTFRLQHQQPKPLGHTAFCSGGCDIHLPFCIIMSHPVVVWHTVVMLHPFVVWHNYVTSICLFVLCSPDTQTYIQKLEKEKRDKAAGQTQDNRSFLAKYVRTF